MASVPPPPLPDLVKSLPNKYENPNPPRQVTIEDDLNDITGGLAPYLTTDREKPDVFNFKHVVPVLQAGPTCGLVAVAMISSLSPRNLTVEELLEDAQALGYSKSGEMFSVDNMARFVIHEVGDYFSVEVFSNGLAHRKDSILNDLLSNKALYLVPYDADRNHSPACLRGHKAHWAVICGAAVCQGKLLLFARQGKSRHIGVWSFDDLARSNSNLFEICPNRIRMPDKYICFDLRISMAEESLGPVVRQHLQIIRAKQLHG